MLRSFSPALVAFACLFLAGSATALEPAPQPVLARLPVKEITVFKDGHAFLLHEGTMPVEADGTVVLDTLPSPVLGTFWPYTAEAKTKLRQVTAGRRNVRVERTALTLRELAEANPGAQVMVREGGPATTSTATEAYPATIIGFLERSSAELAAAAASTDEPAAQKSNLLLLKTADGTKAVPFERVVDLKFLGPCKTRSTSDEFRNRLTMHLDFAADKPPARASVGMAYLQKGIRWIPNYRVELGAGGKATVKLQATLLNELTDLDDVTLNLVVGVPTFQFKDTTDPIALSQNLQQATAQLSQYFESNSRSAYMMSNSMMTQVNSRMTENQARPVAAAPADLGPDVAGQGKNEDLFIYTVHHVSLKKGQRMVLPVSQAMLDYKDVFTLDLPYAPPHEFRRSINPGQAEELAKLLNAPKAMHKVRLKNSSPQPLTTAPALVLKDGRVLAQGMMTYTAPGASVDLALTTAVDIKVKKADKETGRVPDGMRWNGTVLQRVDLKGAIVLGNYRNQPIEVEIVRHVLGNVNEASADGRIERVNLLEDTDGAVIGGYPYPYWWGWYSWPAWWHHYNGVGRVTWNVRIEPGKEADVSYKWHYYWQG